MVWRGAYQHQRFRCQWMTLRASRPCAKCGFGRPKTRPSLRRIYQQAAARMANLPDGYEELPGLAESLCN